VNKILILLTICLSGGVLRYLEEKGSRGQAQLARLMERILSLTARLGLACLCIGLPLFIAGRALNDLIVAQVGAYVLVFGVLLIAIRVVYFIAEEMVGQGLESMT